MQYGLGMVAEHWSKVALVVVKMSVEELPLEVEMEVGLWR